MSEAIDYCVAALAETLRTEMTALQNVRTTWPEPNKPLAMPSATITWSNDVYTPLQPYLLDKDDPSEEVGHEADPVLVRRVVGQHDFKVQIDLWARNKVERNTLARQLFSVLNPDHEVPGISLELEDYFGEWVHFSMDSQKLDESEAPSQRQEWRVIVVLLAQCKAVLEKLEPLMITIENNLTTPDTIE